MHQPQRRVRALQGGQPRRCVLAAIKDGKHRVPLRHAQRCSVAADDAAASPAVLLRATTPHGRGTIDCDRVIARLGATPPRKLVESFGVEFPEHGPGRGAASCPTTYESNVPGLYIIGALGGYPLIKQAMNQGYEVVEYILGRKVEPADEPLLRRKFASFPRARRSTRRSTHDPAERAAALAASTALQLREFMLDSDIRAPKPGERHLRAQRLHQLVLMHRRRRGRGGHRRGRGPGQRGHRSRRRVLRRDGPDLRPPALRHRHAPAATAC